MILIDPLTLGEVEVFTDEAHRHLASKGFMQKAEKPKKPTRKRTSKTKEQ